MKAVGGTAYIKVDGESLELAGSWSVSPTRNVKTGVAGLSGPAGYTKAPRIPFMEGSIIDNGSKELIKKLEDKDNATVTLELVNGKSYYGSEMYLAGEPSHDLATGEISIRLEGKVINEM